MLFPVLLSLTGRAQLRTSEKESKPPLIAGSAPSGDGYSLIQRDDGAQQVAYKGKPLYYWIKDAKPGDKTGDGVNNVWRVATP